MHHSFTVDQLKTRLDKFLAEQLPQFSRSRIQRDIEAGMAAVNGIKVLESKHVVRKNDSVQYQAASLPAGRAGSKQEQELKPANIPLKVLYHDHGLLIIDKPAGLTVHPGAGFKGETLASALLYHIKDIRLVGEDHRPGIVHRLDKDTSGVMLVATNAEMYEYLKEAFAERKIKKEYVALVAGRVERPHGFIDSPIGKSRADFRKQTAKNPAEAKPALTEYKVLEYLPLPQPPHQSLRCSSAPVRGRPKSSPLKEEEEKQTLDGYTLLLVKLHTGRTHQIRVHMASIGHPLMGDALYGSRKTRLEGLHRQFLHAKKIEVRLPDGTWIEAEGELADDLKETLSNLGSKIVKIL